MAISTGSHDIDNDIIMSAMASQITVFSIVLLNRYSGADQRKHQNSASLAFVRGIHWWPVNSLHKWPVMREIFPFADVIMDISPGTFWPRRRMEWLQCVHPTRDDLYSRNICVSCTYFAYSVIISVILSVHFLLVSWERANEHLLLLRTCISNITRNYDKIVSLQSRHLRYWQNSKSCLMWHIIWDLYISMGLLPDTYNCGLRMHRECRERFPHSPTSKVTAS